MSEAPDPIEDAVARAICGGDCCSWDECIAAERSCPRERREEARAAIAAHLAALDAACQAVMSDQIRSINDRAEMIRQLAAAWRTAETKAPSREAGHE